MDVQNKIICGDCNGNGYRKDHYGEVYQCESCESQGEITNIHNFMTAKIFAGTKEKISLNHKENLIWLVFIGSMFLLLILSIFII